MGIFSEELLQLDRNTVRYMMDEQQETIERLKEQVRQQKKEQDLFLIRLIKTQAAKGVSAEECVRLLALEPELVRSVFEALQKDPNADEMTLYERLTK